MRKLENKRRHPIRSTLPPLSAAALLWTAGVQAEETTQLAAADAVVLPVVEVRETASASLTAPDAAQAREEIEHTAGAVEIVDDEQWRGTQARTIKDVLGYTAGVFAQPKWGEDTRLSIRGSSLSRNFHLRGVQLLADGIPLNAADGSADFQEIDPTAYAYTEVYKGANALRYGANSLGGALNFVTASGRGDDAGTLRFRADGGSFGMWRGQLAGGAQAGDFDGAFSASYLKQDGYRDHSDGTSRRASANLGWRIAPEVETRVYFLGADLEQRIPGSVTREAALHDPKTAAVNNVRNDQQRNMQTWRLADKTTIRLDGLTAEIGATLIEKQLIHPIFQYLDYEYHDGGVFGRLLFDAPIAGHANRFTVGANLFDGHVDNTQYVNGPGAQQGALLSASKDSSDNFTLYAEDSFQLRPDLALIVGTQYVDAQRRRADRFNNDPTTPVDENDTSGVANYDFWSPRLGLLWQASPAAQVFANVSRSAEAPTFGELNFTNAALADTQAQRATTIELGTRGESGDLRWDAAIYRAWLRHEFQFFDIPDANGNSTGNYQVTNADRTIHQGLELAGGWTFARGLVVDDSLSLQLAYTYNDFHFDGDDAWGSNALPGAPRHYLRSEVLYRQATGFYAGPNVEWVPQAYYVDNANATRTKSYALLGLRAGYEPPSQRWSVYLDARNLADTNYIASASVAARATPTSALYEPGDGIAVSAGVSARW